MSLSWSDSSVTSSINRRGFTLVEIMVSLMIFVVVSGAMVSILMMSSELFRRGEFSRSANDETIAVLGAVTDDLNHLVPESGDGWFYAGIPNRSGNTMISFTTTGQNANGLGTRGQNARTLIGLWVDETPDEKPKLRRVTLDDTLDILDFIGSLLTNNGLQGRKVTHFETLTAGGYDSKGSRITLLSITKASVAEDKAWFGRQVMRELAGATDLADLEFTGVYNWVSPTDTGKGESQVPLEVIIPSSILTEGCLHFSAWLALNELPSMQRPKDKGTLYKGQPDWEQIDHNGSTILGPWGKAVGGGGGAEVYDTRPKNWKPSTTAGASVVRKPPFPSALRLSFVLTGGGRFAPAGYLQSDLANDASGGSFRVSGLQGLPSIPGSMVRVGDEWIAYQSVRSGSIYYEGLDPLIGASRGARRSTVTAHQRGTVVQIGQSYSLVRSLPR
jgi:prepilin-type N-terminal cleavage/methylation domain-containing protein